MKLLLIAGLEDVWVKFADLFQFGQECFFKTPLTFFFQTVNGAHCSVTLEIQFCLTLGIARSLGLSIVNGAVWRVHSTHNI